MGRLREDYADLSLIEGLEPKRILFLHLALDGEILVWARVVYSDSCDAVGLVTRDVAEILSLLAPECATWLSKITYSKKRPVSEKQRRSIEKLLEANTKASLARRARHEFAHQISQNLSY